MMARDEIDIVACNIAYHLEQGVSHVIVTDNGSVDGTRDVLADLARSAPVTVRDQEPTEWQQGVWVSEMARLAYEQFGADWVINTDADEFFVAPDSTLVEAVAAIPEPLDVVWVTRHDFVCVDRPRERTPPQEMLFRKRASLHRHAGTWIPPKAIHRGAADVVVTFGCHDASSSSFRRREGIEHLVTFHYPVRSFEQFEPKVRNAGSGFARTKDLPLSTGSEHRTWYDQLLNGELADEFRDHHHFDPEELRQALASGEVVEDHRLAGKLPESGTSSSTAPARARFDPRTPSKTSVMPFRGSQADRALLELLDLLRQDRDAKAKALEAMQRSTSWRMTAPLRRGMDALRRRRD